MTHKGKSIEIEYTALPKTIGGITGDIDEDGYYLILINNTRIPLHQRKALGHELSHVYLDHFSQDRPIQEIEAEAERNAWKYYRLYKAGALDNT